MLRQLGLSQAYRPGCPSCRDNIPRHLDNSRVTWQTRAHNLSGRSDRPVREGEGGRGARVHQRRRGRARHHGRRHRRGVRPQRHRRGRRRDHRGGAGAGPGHADRLHRPGGGQGKLSEADRDALLGRVSFAVGLDALDDVDLVIEAVPEQLDLKQRIFAELDRVCKPEAILATNTSSLSVTEISVATSRPNQVIGMHFFNPAPVMKLVEVVRTVVTAHDVVADIEALCARLGKVDVTISDRAGFIANALLFGYLNHAVAMYEAPLRHPRGHRRGHEARLRPADGPARADGPDRPRHRVRDPRHHVPPGRARPPARPGAADQADGHRRPARAQVRPGLLHLREAGLAGGRSRRADAGSPRTPRSADGGPRRSPRSAWSAPAPWPPASSRSSPRPATRSSR